MKELFGAMALAFPEIEGASKDRNNPAFKSKYADLSSVVEAIKPALVKNNLFFVQHTHEQQGGVCIETIVCHKSGDQFSFGKLFVPAGKQDAQGYGSALTYARRYSLMTAFGVCPEDDDGNAAAKTAPRPANNVEPTSNIARQKPEPLTGPMKTRAEARTKYGEIVRELNACEDEDTLHAFIESERAVLDQYQSELPAAWEGDGADFIGLRAEIDAAKVRVMNPEAERLVNMVRAG